MKLTKAERSELGKLITDFGKSKDALSAFLTDLHARWEGKFEDKSEGWQDGDAGQAAQERIDAVQSWLDDLGEVEVPDVSEIE